MDAILEVVFNFVPRLLRWCAHTPARYTTVESIKAKERWAASRVEAVSREAMAAMEAVREEALKEGKASATHPDEEWRGRRRSTLITPRLVTKFESAARLHSSSVSKAPLTTTCLAV